ncbi:uncharacterized protein LOC129222446 [Uloborus diversus]|uniref:uncharacterized protein LOC129222446 n=1 Tax=Uloborus diversus TaxID=327109 RepID=UPI00240A09C8|nr:uncharacterized protein LOC129222446 [Uloborus diversus]
MSAVNSDNKQISSTLSIEAESFTPGKMCNSDESKNNARLSGELPSIYTGTTSLQVEERVSRGENKEVLLCTVLIKALDSSGRFQLCRALLDPGSQANFITEDCVNRLGLGRKKANIAVSCLGATAARTNGLVDLEFSPHFDSKPKLKSSAFVMNKIVGNLPHTSIDVRIQEAFKDLVLADPSFHKSARIDILLGIDIFLQVLKGEISNRGDGYPSAVRSSFGWIISGSVNLFRDNVPLVLNNIDIDTNELISKFWELDSVPSVSFLSSAEKACEEHFKNTHSRAEDGKYIVKLPFHTSPTELGESRQHALRRLNAVERSLSSNPAKYKQYQDFMKEYLELKHMEPVPETDYAKSEAYYIPHFPVLRESSTTTKLRVVFDASSKSSSGYSLNDLLMVGPRLQLELYPILLRFRTFPVAVCADVEKMFRQIRVHPEDVDWQRILWRSNLEEPVKEYRLLTVTYGTASAPFLSTRTIHQLALDEKDSYPLASNATLNHFYVDDLLSGASSEEEASELVKQLKTMMAKGGFNLRKWKSNNTNVIKEFLDEEEAANLGTEVKVLGIQWCPKADYFSFSIESVKQKLEYSKREILSEISRVFDPLGLLSPCVVFMKVLLQELWKYKLSWDQIIPEELNRNWISFCEELHLLEQMKIPRLVLTSSHADIELHAFCDASEKAYCAAIYVRCLLPNSDFRVSLLTAKTRVAPLKTQSLPRLELCSALLLADLLAAVLKNIQVPVQNTVAWTDSKITLAWLATEPYKWQAFVANRVSKIQTTIPSVKWFHVRGTENPSDLGTRGLLPYQLISNDMWLRGPNWLSQPMSSFIPLDVTETYSLPELFTSSASNNAPHNSRRGKVNVWTGATRVFAATKDTRTVSEIARMLTTAAYAFVEVSEKPCSSIAVA